jgi:hypothetical protein
MSEELRRAIYEAERGDLRPQFNPSAVVNWQFLPDELAQIEPVLFDRFLDLARPIADGRTASGPEARLQDAGRFFYLIEALKRLGCARLPEILCVLLDEFAQLDERSYDELYLWCLVELSRTDSAHAATYWPQVMALDVRYRGEPWQRPKGVPLVERPYRMTELLFYYYVLYTRTPFLVYRPELRRLGTYRAGSLWDQLKGLAPALRAEQAEITRQALRALSASEPSRPDFGDALGLLNRTLAQRHAAGKE